MKPPSSSNVVFWMILPVQQEMKTTADTKMTFPLHSPCTGLAWVTISGTGAKNLLSPEILWGELSTLHMKKTVGMDPHTWEQSWRNRACVLDCGQGGLEEFIKSRVWGTSPNPDQEAIASGLTTEHPVTSWTVTAQPV